MNILTQLQKEILNAVGTSSLGKTYVWTGGTALAYRLKHRLSEDLDFFTQTLEAPEIFLNQIKILQDRCQLQQERYEEKMNRRLFIFKRDKDIIKMEFVYFPFSPLKKPPLDRTLKVRIDPMEEIAVNKVLSAFQRREPKDAYDLYILCSRKKMDLKKLIEDVQKKFGVHLDCGALVAKLTALSQGVRQLEPLLTKKNALLSAKMIDFFQNKGNRYLERMITGNTDD
ncbi:nucleotidyl transferase AbiEii/AbiGii toxin family protein [Candidatus Peregrinibacteria bacterium]|nr:nucleotidyl transferase AbiEii/AbiGii toxin family protein [Candidatus Peregrinibacteria bacterium]